MDLKERWSFKTKRFRIVAYTTPDSHGTKTRSDGSRANPFGVIVRAYAGDLLLAEDSLWDCDYSPPKSFFNGHRDPDPMNRNCTIMRAARGENVVICHYFPEMVRIVCAAARAKLADMPRVRS